MVWRIEYRTLWHLANSAPANSAPLKLGTHNLGTLQTWHPQTRHMHNYKLGTWLKTLNLPRLQTRHPVGNPDPRRVYRRVRRRTDDTYLIINMYFHCHGEVALSKDLYQNN